MKKTDESPFGSEGWTVAEKGGDLNDAYLSYAHEDKEIAERLVAFLRAKGIAVWWDAMIPPGKKYPRVLEDELDASERVIVLWSKSSVESDWVNNEARRGFEREIIVPVLIEAVELPLEFSGLQAISLVDWTEEEHPGLTQLLEAVPGRRRPSSHDESLPPVVGSRHFLPKVRGRRSVQFSLVVGGVAIAAHLVWSAKPPVRDPPTETARRSVSDAAAPRPFPTESHALPPPASDQPQTPPPPPPRIKCCDDLGAYHWCSKSTCKQCGYENCP